MNAILDWLNGNKTIFGTYLIAIAGFMAQIEVLDVESLIYKALLYFGGLLGTTGAAHKVMKGLKSKEVAE